MIFNLVAEWWDPTWESSPEPAAVAQVIDFTDRPAEVSEKLILVAWKRFKEENPEWYGKFPEYLCEKYGFTKLPEIMTDVELN